MSDFLKDFYLSRDPLNVLLIVDLVFLKDLDSDLLTGESVLTQLHLSEGTLPKMFAYSINIWIRLNTLSSKFISMPKSQKMVSF